MTVAFTLAIHARISIAFARLTHGLRMGVGQQQRHQVGGSIVCHAAAHVHGAVVVNVERGAFALKWGSGLHKQQVGVWVGFQAAVVGTDEGIVDDAGRDEQSAHGVVEVFHLSEHRLQTSATCLASASHSLLDFSR